MIAHAGQGDVRALVEEWVEDIGQRLGHCPIHVRTCRRVAMSFVAWASIHEADQIEPITVMRWLRARGQIVSRKTVLNEMSVIRTFADWLVSCGILSHNRVAGIRLPRAPKSRGCLPFTVDEATRIVAAAEDAERRPGAHRAHGPLRSTFYRFVLLTGLRFSEASAQLWEDIDLESLTLRVTHDKARRNDVIPITRQVADSLVRWRAWSTGPLVFPRVPCNKSLERDMRAAGVEIKAGNWHRFRKCLITTLRRNGADLNQICRVARHVDPRTTMQSYDLHEVDELRPIVQLFPNLPTSPKNS